MGPQKQPAAAKARGALPSQFRSLVQTYHDLRFQFIIAELDLAITFCRVAATTRDPARKRANENNAEIAYEAAAHCLHGAKLSVEMLREIREKTAKLRSLWHPLECACEANRRSE